jgi:hypothetical protein
MKLTKAQYDALPAEVKALFKQEGDEYVAIVNPEDNPESLKRARDRERDAAAQLRKELAGLKKQQEDANAAAETARLEAERKAGDVAALEKSWQTKLEKETGLLKAQLEQRDGSIRKLLVTQSASQLARDISTVPDLMAEQIAKRLTVEYGENGVTTRVLDLDGKPTALSIDDLKKEILADKRYAGILIAGKGSGSGAGSSGAGGGAFRLDDFKNPDGTVNWGKVNAGLKDDPQLLDRVKESMKPAVA